MLLDPKTGKLDARSEALLFAAARAQTVSSVIRPALADGKIVICDRYVDSSLAYQGWARGLGEADVLTLNVWATQGLFPDLVVLLHVEPERGLLRSTEAPDRMELEGQDFHAKVADAYLKIAEEHPERFVVVDGDQTPDEVFAAVRDAVDGADPRPRRGNGPGLSIRRRPSTGVRPRLAVASAPCALPSSPACPARTPRWRSSTAPPSGRITPTCSPGPRAAASRSRRARSRLRCCASSVAAGRAATAGSRSRITTRTSSTSSPRAATSTSTRSGRRSGRPPRAPPRSRDARSS